ncbi:MAG: glycosyltransferase family 4 protein [bacterium]
MSEKKIKVLHIITHLPIGGAQDNTLLTVERLDRKNFDVSLMCSPDGDWLQRAQNIKNLNLIFVHELARKIQVLKDIIAFWKIYAIIKKDKYTIVHTHSSKPGVLGRIAARLAGVPVVIHTIHGFPFHNYMRPIKRQFYINIERTLSRFSDRIVTVSKLNLEKAIELKLAKPDKFVNIYSGIDFQKFDVAIDAAKKKASLGILNGEKIVGMVGRLSEQKAPLDVVKAMPEVLRASPAVRFLIVGDGELRQKVLDLAKELDIESKLTLLGFREDVPELFRILDVYVLTSLWEGLGRSLTEAMYTGRPVVATNVEGVPELVKTGKTGILVEPGDIGAISKAIIKLLNDKKSAKEMGRKAAAAIGQVFTAEIMVKNLEELYQNLLKENLQNKHRWQST